KERLSWISKRVDDWDANATGLETVIGVNGDDKELDVEELEEWADRARVSADFHKDEWRDIVVFMQALIGTTTNDPGAQEPADLDVIETIATRYRARHAESDEDLARWLGHESAIGAAVANRDSRVSDTAVRRTGAPGRPTGMHLVLTEFARRVEENACKPS